MFLILNPNQYAFYHLSLDLILIFFLGFLLFMFIVLFVNYMIYIKLLLSNFTDNGLLLMNKKAKSAMCEFKPLIVYN